MTSVLNVDSIAAKDGTSPVELTKQSAAKVWVNFNGTGTIAERDSFGVTSLTDKTTGQYDVNFSSGFTDANYSGVANGWRSGVGHAFVTHVPTGNTTTSTTSLVLASNTTPSFTDVSDICVNYHGDLA
jgi:hypothetical protein